MTFSPEYITIGLVFFVGVVCAYTFGLAQGFKRGVEIAKEIQQDSMEEAAYIIDRRTSRIPRKPRGGVPGGPFGTPAPPPKSP